MKKSIALSLVLFLLLLSGCGVPFHTKLDAYLMKGQYDLADKLIDTERDKGTEYNEKNYHNPSDEYKDDWDFAGMEQMARFGFTIAVNVSNR